VADACEAEGLVVTEFTPETLTRLKDVFPEEASVRNPVDMIASANAESYRVALEIVLADPGVDAAIAAFVPPLGVRQSDVAQAIVEAVRAHPQTPVMAVLMGRDGLPEGRAELKGAGVPAYIFPESAVRALATLHRYRVWKERPVQAPRRFPVDDDAVKVILDRAEAEGRSHLLEPEAYAVLESYGIPVTPHQIATSEDEAAEAAAALGGPGGAEGGLTPDPPQDGAGWRGSGPPGRGAVRAGYRELRERIDAREPDATVHGVLVAPFRRDGREMILGMSTDPTFGPVLVFGLGGIYVETFQDVAIRVPPVTLQEAQEMIREIRSFPLLEGVRGEEGVCLDTVAEAIQRLAQLVVDHDRIASIDVNPFLAFPRGGMALDARVEVGRRAPSGRSGSVRA
jgi:acetate---CoA ligase (ADP-forming)